jgi:hypothetical protein
MSSFIPYPELENKNFYKKIYYKKEFYDTKPDPLPDPDNQSNKTMEILFPKKGDFKLQSAQIFLKNFISGATPYGGILVFHGTGAGKTCAAIVIAERFHNRVDETGKKILIIASPNIQNEFIKTIFDFGKESVKGDERRVVQCTGRTYKIGSELKYLSRTKQESRIMKIIKDIYELTGRDSLRNKLLKETGWDGVEDTINDNIRAKIKEIYSDRVIIVDEVHNRAGMSDKDDKFPTALKAIIENSVNIKLILMSATPMVNSPDDIMFPINLLRLNDKRPFIKTRSIFKSNGDFSNDGEKLFKEIAKGYVSYVRGEDPPRFPYKLIPPEAIVPKPKYFFNGSKIPDNKAIKNTNVIQCEMSMFQYNTYNNALKRELKGKMGGLLLNSSQAGNIVFPSTSDLEGDYGLSSFGNSTSNEHALIEFKDSHGNLIYKYSSFSQGFLSKENIGKYSIKFLKILVNTIGSVGISFIYSHWIPSGIIPLALMLEENGFEPATITGKERRILQSNTRKPTICYVCGKPKHPNTDHEWGPAKYIMLTGSLDLSQPEKAKITGYINREDNINGKMVKVILGSEVSGEGIDFKRIRQVHIVEPWYNQAKLDQVEGRAVRNGSHRDLPPEHRNVEIFKYSITPPSKLKNNEEFIETIDEHNYRIAEDKDKKIKKVEYILKEIAVDCLFQRHNNIRNINRTINLENSRGKIIKYVTGDKPYSRECNYMKNCTYKCEWEPGENNKVVIDKSTYGIEFSEADVEKAREVIIKLYRINPVIDILTIFKSIKEEYSSLDDIYIYLALESLMDKKSEHILQDQYGREGYLVEKKDLYIFQPFELDNINAPFIYKTTPFETKPEVELFTATGIKKNKIDNKKNIISGKDILIEQLEIYKNNILFLKDYIKLNKKYDDIFIDITLHKLSDKKTLSLLKYIVSPEYVKNKNNEINSFRDIIFKYYLDRKNIFQTKKMLAIMVGNLCSQWGRSKYGSGKKVKNQWGKCDADIESIIRSDINNYKYDLLWKKVPKDMRIREDENISRNNYLSILKKSGIQPVYIGTVEAKKEGGEKYLKLMNFEVKKDIDVVSKRKELRGRTCIEMYTQDIKKIITFLEKEISNNIQNINIKKSNKKILRPNMCIQIEFLLRILNKTTNDVWFYENYFLQDD